MMMIITLRYLHPLKVCNDRIEQVYISFLDQQFRHHYFPLLKLPIHFKFVDLQLD